MIIVLQRVAEASVTVGDEHVGSIGTGHLALVCALGDDVEADVDWLADKVVDLRLFPDEVGRTNRDLLDVGGQVLVVSQFTLAADWRKGRRPGFTRAASPERAQELVARFAQRLEQRGVGVAHGRFGAIMDVRLLNSGPFTLVLDSAQRPAG